MLQNQNTNQPGQDCLTRIEGKVDGAHAKLDVIHRDFMGLITKLVLAVIGSSIAVVGVVKYAGTPIITDISFYLSWVAGVIGLGTLIRYWRKFRWQYAQIWISFILFLFYSVICRTFIFKSGVEAAPWWYAPGIDALMSWVCIALIIGVWKKRFH